MTRWVLPATVLGVVLVLVGCVSPAERISDAHKRERLAETEMELGLIYLQRGQVKIAQGRLDEARRLEPDDPRINHAMAWLELRLKDDAAAERYYRRAATGTPPDPDAQNDFGVFLCARGHQPEAIKWFTRAADNPLYRTPGAAYENAGLCLMGPPKPEPAKAAVYFGRALKVDPRRPVSLYQIARIRYDAGQAVAARAFIKRYLATGAETPAGLLLAVRIERALGDADAEASYLAQLRSKFPHSPEAKSARFRRRATGD